jgi:hypothetical protein
MYLLTTYDNERIGISYLGDILLYMEDVYCTLLKGLTNSWHNVGLRSSPWLVTGIC